MVYQLDNFVPLQISHYAEDVIKYYARDFRI